jgi:pimeloyl-ACP methyl ester carboxylesterase
MEKSILRPFRLSHIILTRLCWSDRGTRIFSLICSLIVNLFLSALLRASLLTFLTRLDQNNITLYPAFHEYFRTRQPPLLAIWGKNDAFFIPPGAEAFKKDLPNAEVHFVDGGHFALENHVEEIGGKILEFFERNGI